MEVFVTPTAEKHFETIVNHLQEKWGSKTLKQFIDKTDKLFNLLQNYPLIGQVEKDNIRGFQLTRQTKILYRIRGTKVIILAFFDVRKNPEKKFNG
ncbi:MAG: type II toxin-antitoxin system RelE/ParE family toxin [Cyclobacteriaceae bacterium]|nr:type II toxin-antitoxin system RelE/ParE family toxin [Cyclobacteriaceae bacterium]